MYSKKTHINVNKKNIPNDFIDNDEQTKKIFSTRNNIKKNSQKIIDLEEKKNVDNSINNDYFKEYYYSKKNKKKIISYYSKKKFKSFFLNNDKPQISNYIIHPIPFYSDLKSLNSFDKKQKSVTYTIKNPQKEKSKNNKNLENNNSKNTLNEYEDDLNNLNSNNSNSIYTDFLNNTEINKKSDINKSYMDSRRGNIDLSRYDKNFSSKKVQKNRDKPDLFQQSSSNMSKGISFIMDLSKEEDKYNISSESPNKMNKITLNSSIIRNMKSPFCSSRYYESIFVKKKKNKTPNIKKQIEYRKKKFEKMIEIEKKIKDYFKENGIKLKNRELYHQSAIMIQSSFRAYLSRKNLNKELKKFVGIRLIFDSLNKLLSAKNINYYKNFFNNIKKYNNRKYNNIFLMPNEDYQYHIKNKSVILKKSYILKKNYIIPKNNDLLKIELCNTFNIINEQNSNDNKNLIILNKQLLHEKNLLEEEIKKLKLENEKLQKDNETYKSKESQFSQLSNKSLTVNKIVQNNIHKNDQNIENVSIELREMKKKKKKIDGLNIPVLNLKKNANLLDKFWKNQSDFKKYKYLCLKYLILKKDIILKEYFRKEFYKYLNTIKNKKHNKNENKENKGKDEINKIYKFKTIIENIYFKFRNNMCSLFFVKLFKFLFLKEVSHKGTLFIPKYKIQITKINNIDDSLKKKNLEQVIKEKKQILKRLIKDKIKKQNILLHNKFTKFYYLGLLNKNINNNNSFTNIINTNTNKIYTNPDNILNHNKIKDIEIQFINKKEINNEQNQNKKNESNHDIYKKKIYEKKNCNKKNE